MRSVFSINDIPWQNLRGLPGARGFEYKALSDNDYSSTFNAELVRLEQSDHSVPHVEPWSHLLYFLERHRGRNNRGRDAARRDRHCLPGKSWPKALIAQSGRGRHDRPHNLRSATKACRLTACIDLHFE